MNPKTGQIHDIENSAMLEALEREAQTKLVPMTERDVQAMTGEPLPVRKNWMRNRPCPCKSGKKFKRCCWSKYA